MHILCSIHFFSKNSPVHEIMWKNVEPDTLQMTVYNMAYVQCVVVN